MGTGFHGGFGNTKGYASGDASFMNKKDNFVKWIRKRNDVDPGGKFDIIAHGTSKTIEIEHNGKVLEANSRIIARLVKTLPGYNGQSIRLLSCNTGAGTKSIAQNIANKLNITVWAPNNYLWVTPSGKHYVAGMKADGSPDLSKKGHFVKFTPGGKK